MYSVNNVLAIQALEIEGMTTEEIHKLLPEVRYSDMIVSVERLMKSSSFLTTDCPLIEKVNRNKTIEGM